MRGTTGTLAGLMLIALAATPEAARAEARGTQLQVRLTLQDRCEIVRDADNATRARCSTGVAAVRQPAAAASAEAQVRSSLPLPRQPRDGTQTAFVF